jgi:hypothetical protein
LDDVSSDVPAKSIEADQYFLPVESPALHRLEQRVWSASRFNPSDMGINACKLPFKIINLLLSAYVDRLVGL